MPYISATLLFLSREENQFNGNWCAFNPSDFISLVKQSTTPIFLYAIYGHHLSREEKIELKLFRQLFPSTVFHFVANAGIVPVKFHSHFPYYLNEKSDDGFVKFQKQENPIGIVSSKPYSNANISSRHRRHTSVHPSREGPPVSFSSPGTATAEIQLPDPLALASEQLSDLGFLNRSKGMVLLVNDCFLECAWMYLLTAWQSASVVSCRIRWTRCAVARLPACHLFEACCKINCFSQPKC